MSPETRRFEELPIQDIRQILESLPELNAAYVHGSVARGEARRESDLDLAFLTFPGEQLSADAKEVVEAQIALLVGRDVDIGILTTANLIYARQVLGCRVTLLEKDPGAAALFFATAMGEYANFRPQRHIVEKAYEAR